MHGLVSRKRTVLDYPNKKAIEGWLSFLKGVDNKSSDVPILGTTKAEILTLIKK